MSAVVSNDAITFFKLLVSQGFDLWLSQACCPVDDMKVLDLPREDLTNMNLLNKVRQLIENDFCRGRDLVQGLDPALIRFVHRIEGLSEPKDFKEIVNRGDTTDEEAKAEKERAQEEEKKGDPDEEVKEEEKKDVEEEDKKEEEQKESANDKAKRKAAKEQRLKEIKAKLQKMKDATMWQFWSDWAAASKDSKSLTDDQKKKLSEAKAKLTKPKSKKIFEAWKSWSKKHHMDR